MKDLIDLYVAGDLEAGEASAVEEHLLRCGDCRREAAAYRARLGDLASLRSEAQPDRLPPFFWQGIQKAILTDGEGSVRGRGAFRSVGRTYLRRPALLALAAAVLLVVTAYIAVSFLGAGRSSAPDPASPVATKAAENRGAPFLPPGTPIVPENHEAVPAGAPDQDPSFEL